MYRFAPLRPLILSFLLAFLVVIPVSGVGCSSRSSISLGFPRRYSSLPWKVAEEEGLFEEEGIGVRLRVFDDDEKLWRDWARGSLDAAYTGIGGCVNARAHDSDPVIVMFGAKSDNSGIVARPGLGTLTDLVGKKVGVESGSEEHFFLLFVLERQGIKHTALQMMDVSQGEGGEMLATGELDAWATREPYLSEAVTVTGGKVIVSCDEIAEFMSYQLSVLAEEADKNYPEVRRLIRIWFKALDSMEKNVSQTQRLAVRFLNMTQEQVEDLSQGVSFYTREEELGLVLSPDPFKWLGAVEYALKFQEVIPREFDIAGIMNLNLAAEAVAVPVSQ